MTAPGRVTEGAPAMFKPFESGYDPGHPVDQAIMATRNVVFPPARAAAVTSNSDERPGTASVHLLKALSPDAANRAYHPLRRGRGGLAAISAAGIRCGRPAVLTSLPCRCAGRPVRLAASCSPGPAIRFPVGWFSPVIRRDDHDRAVCLPQAGARHRPDGLRRLSGLARRPGRSQHEHLGVCRPVEQCPGGRLIRYLGR